MRDTPDGERYPHTGGWPILGTPPNPLRTAAPRGLPRRPRKEVFTTRRTTPVCPALRLPAEPPQRGVPPLARRRAAVEGSPDPSPSEPAPPPREVVTPPRWLRPPRIFVRRTPRRRGEWSRRRGESCRAAHRRPQITPPSYGGDALLGDPAALRPDRLAQPAPPPPPAVKLLTRRRFAGSFPLTYPQK